MIFYPSILDIKLELNNEKIINIEIQAAYQSFWAEQSLTYLCRNYNQLKEGDGYEEIKSCVHIGILGDDAFRKTDPRYTGEFFSKYRMLNVKNHKEYSSKFEIRMLLLNRINEVLEEEKNNHNGLYYWAKMFTARSWEELKMIAQENPMMQSLAGTVRKLSAEEKVAMACEARLRYSNDMATIENEKKKALKEMEEAKKETEEAKKETEAAKKKLQFLEAKLQQELKDKEQEIAELKRQLQLKK